MSMKELSFPFDPIYPDDPFDDFPDTDLGICGECDWVGLLDDCPKSRSLMVSCPRCLGLGMAGEIVSTKPSRESVRRWVAERPEIKSLKWFHQDVCHEFSSILDTPDFWLRTSFGCPLTRSSVPYTGW